MRGAVVLPLAPDDAAAQQADAPLVCAGAPGAWVEVGASEDRTIKRVKVPPIPGAAPGSAGELICPFIVLKPPLAVAEEQRPDPADPGGLPRTLSEFIEEYGGSAGAPPAEWIGAAPPGNGGERRQDPDAPSDPGAAFTLGNFIEEYGGSREAPPDEWVNAPLTASAGCRPSGCTFQVLEVVNVADGVSRWDGSLVVRRIDANGWSAAEAPSFACCRRPTRDQLVSAHATSRWVYLDQNFGLAFVFKMAAVAVLIPMTCCMCCEVARALSGRSDYEQPEQQQQHQHDGGEGAASRVRLRLRLRPQNAADLEEAVALSPTSGQGRELAATATADAAGPQGLAPPDAEPCRAAMPEATEVELLDVAEAEAPLAMAETVLGADADLVSPAPIAPPPLAESTSVEDYRAQQAQYDRETAALDHGSQQRDAPCPKCEAAVVVPLTHRGAVQCPNCAHLYTPGPAVLAA